VIGTALGLLGLGFVMGFSPTLYGVTLHVLTRSPAPPRPIRSVVWMTVGLAVASTVLVLVFRVVDPETLIHVWQGRFEALLVTRAVDLAAGVVLVGAGGIAWLLRTRPRRQRKTHVHDAGTREMFLIGFANTFLGVSGIATMYVTGRVITAASPDWFVRALVYLVFLIGVVGPYVGVAYGWERLPRLAHAITGGVDRLGRVDFRPAVAIALVGVGIVFVVLGFVGHTAR
jgi:cytochrome c biogenesis protein CcdA